MKKALMISCFEWYKNRLEPIREILIERGYEVTILTSDFSHGLKKPFPDSSKRSECTYIHVPQYKKNISIQRMFSHWCFGKTVGNYIRKYKPDLIYLLVPPNNTARYCSAYKRRNPESVFIADIIDIWPEGMPLPDKLRKSLPARIWKNLRDKSLISADYVFTECRLFQEQLKGILDPSRTKTLHLFKNQSEEQKNLIKNIVELRSFNAADPIKLAYVGSMNHLLDIDGICQVLRTIHNMGYKTELHAIGDGLNKENFETAVQKTGCKAFFYGCSFDEMKKINILAPCNAAFNIMKPGVLVGLTIKSIDYFAYGLPVINNIKGDTWSVVQENAIGINICDEGVQESQIEELLHIEGNRVLQVYKDYFERDSFVSAVKSASCIP